MNPQGEKNIKFEDYIEQLPESSKKLLKSYDIDNHEKLSAFSAAIGLDMEKLLKYDPTNSSCETLTLEDVLLNPNDPLLSNPVFGEKTDDPFLMPERIFTDDKAVEYHIRIKLNNAPLPIWRELKIPSNITLEVFSLILMMAMGWENRHLHMFKKGDIRYKNTACINEDMNMGFCGIGFKSIEDTNEYSVAQLLKEKGDRMKFVYDFGDNWEHDIWLKGIREYAPQEVPDVIVVKGKSACPPEDCGGIWGYEDLLRIHAKKRRTKEEKELLKWFQMYDSDYNPEKFNLDAAQYYVDDVWGTLIWK